MSTLTLDAPALKALLDAYAPGGEITVKQGKLFYRLPKAGLDIALDRLSAGATLTTEDLVIAMNSIEMRGSELISTFSLHPTVQQPIK